MLRPLFIAIVAASASACASDVFPRDAATREASIDIVDVACPPDRPTRCSGECVGDTDSNRLHCGASCTMCEAPAHGSATCTSGVCGIECAAGYVAMGSVCIDAPAPRPVRPLTNARVSVTQPTLRWANPEGANRSHITICRDRPCTSVVTEFDAEGTTARVPNDLGPGVWFWNLRAIDRGVVSAARSATWSFHTPAVSGPVEWSWAARPDYNGDGIDDLTVVYADATTMSSTTEVFFGGHGTDGVGQRVGTGFMRPIGDVNGDGFSDFALFDRGATLFAGAPDITSLRSIQSLTAVDLEGLGYLGLGGMVGDFDGDGYGDVLPTRNGIVVAYGSEAGWSRFETLRGAASLAVAFDVDADGFDDVIGSDRWWQGGGAQLGAPRMLATGWGAPWLLATGDVDGDGYLDAVEFPDFAELPMRLLRGNADGPIPVVRDTTTPNGQRTPWGDPGDLDGDGHHDLLTWSSSTAGVIALRGTPEGYANVDFFTPNLPCVLNYMDAGSAARSVGDFDNSGHEDFVLVCRSAGEVFLHLDANTPAARWVPLNAPHATLVE